jgi:hypothetical protein
VVVVVVVGGGRTGEPVPVRTGGFGLVITPPSASDRLSSMSTVCVIASVPVGDGWAAAGAIVSVTVDGSFASGRRQPAARTLHNTIGNTQYIGFLTGPPTGPIMQFP